MTKQTNAKPFYYEGILFRSKIEGYMYKQLHMSGIDFDYEQQTFLITEEFRFPNSSFEKYLNGKGEFKDRGKGKNHPALKYTPDFTSPTGSELKFVIEMKGRAFPDFSRTWKLFKRLITKNEWKTVLFMPRTQRDCNKVIELIKELNLE